MEKENNLYRPEISANWNNRDAITHRTSHASFSWKFEHRLH